MEEVSLKNYLWLTKEIWRLRITIVFKRCETAAMKLLLRLLQNDIL